MYLEQILRTQKMEVKGLRKSCYTTHRLQETLYGKIYRGIYDETKLVAIKISKMDTNRRGSENPRMETAVMSYLPPHPNVVRYIDDMDTPTLHILVCEYVHGKEMFDVIEKRGRINETEAKNYMKQLLKGLAHIHKYRICHRDISIENILVDEKMKMIKICDFGASYAVEDDDSVPAPKGVLPGKIRNCCPEVIERKKYNGFLADVYGAGVCLLDMLTASLWFDVASSQEDPRYAYVEKGELKDVLVEKSSLSKSAADLIQKMLSREEKRPSVAQCLEHEWFKD